MSRKKNERHSAIRSLLLEHQEMKVADLARELSVTPETIRKDLDELEEQHIIVREHGRASLFTAITELPIEFRSREFADEKRRVTMRAFQEISNGQIVYLDSGSTLLSGIQMLRSKKDLTIVTTNIPLAIECVSMGFEVIVIGGQLHRSAYNTYGPIAMEALKHLHFDVAILGISGLCGKNEFALNTLESAAIDREVISRSDQVIIIMNRNKIYQKGHYPFISFDETRQLITGRLSNQERNLFTTIESVIEV